MLLDGLRILDLSRTEPGSRATQLLADHGAEVLFVEPSGGRALRRRYGWAYLGRGKRSVTADLWRDHDRRLARDLATEADVVVSTFRPGVLERLGLDYPSLAAVNPQIIGASITGFGSIGPWSSLRGYEGVVLAKLGAFAGFEGAAARPGPKFISVPYASFAASQLTIHGITRVPSGAEDKRIRTSSHHQLGSSVCRT